MEKPQRKGISRRALLIGSGSGVVLGTVAGRLLFDNNRNFRPVPESDESILGITEEDKEFYANLLEESRQFRGQLVQPSLIRKYGITDRRKVDNLKELVDIKYRRENMKNDWSIFGVGTLKDRPDGTKGGATLEYYFFDSKGERLLSELSLGFEMAEIDELSDLVRVSQYGSSYVKPEFQRDAAGRLLQLPQDLTWNSDEQKGLSGHFVLQDGGDATIKIDGFGLPNISVTYGQRGEELQRQFSRP